MKITIYELIGLIKDNKAPKRVLYDGYIWNWTGDDYQTILRNEKEQFLITGMYYQWFTNFIKEEVEIIEEKPKHIEELETNEKNTLFTMQCYTGIPEVAEDWNFNIIKNKLDELTKALNYLLDKDKK